MTEGAFIVATTAVAVVLNLPPSSLALIKYDVVADGKSPVTVSGA